jgi:hypothetical protein
LGSESAGLAPSTSGTFLLAFTFGHVRQLDAVASRLLVNLAARAPLLAGAGQVAYLDIDDTVKAIYGWSHRSSARTLAVASATRSCGGCWSLAR